ncbi:MAG: beta-mannosidase [Prevotellaceae bacterium]|nr:beta-mannosidase [Candidatus Minthosoma caballi]
MKRKSLLLICMMAVISCFAAKITPAQQLVQRMQKLQKHGYMYGHQDDPFYGISWQWEMNRSDTKELTGDFPGVMGFDLGGIEMGDAKNLDSVPFIRIHDEIIAHHKRGGIITISWHPRNPLLGTTAWIESDVKAYDAAVAALNGVGRSDLVAQIDNPKSTVASILRGGKCYDKFQLWLKRVADFMLTLKDEKGNPVPVIFRPWHEYNGAWFWWGKDNCSAQQYKDLWNMTQDYMNEKLPGSIVWSNSPNLQGTHTLAEFLERWPGDERVDILGEDAYQWGTEEDFKKGLDADLAFMTEYASQHGLLLALTECGYQNSPDATWWTRVLKPIMDKYPVCYFLPWRNWPAEHFGAAKELGTADDFLKLYKAKNTLFLNEIKKVK